MPGGARPGAGRKKGVPNKSTGEIRELARQYAPAALARLAEIMQSQDEKAAVAACDKLLDRGYGKAAQPIDGDGEGGNIRLKHVIEVAFVNPPNKA